MKAPKQRNPFATHARFRKGAGKHEKPKKALRQKNKMKLKKELAEA